MRKIELHNLQVHDVTKQGEILMVRVRDTKNYKDRTFTVEGKFKKYIDTYAALRKPITPHDQFFVNYQKGKCTVQPIGENKLGKIPYVIASFLGLEGPERYTGHSFRRTSATILADSGADIVDIKRLGDWASNKTAEIYIKHSLKKKRTTSNTIQTQILPQNFSSKKALKTHENATPFTSRNIKILRPQNFQGLSSATNEIDGDDSNDIQIENQNMNIPKPILDGKQNVFNFYDCNVNFGN